MCGAAARDRIDYNELSRTLLGSAEKHNTKFDVMRKTHQKLHRIKATLKESASQSGLSMSAFTGARQAPVNLRTMLRGKSQQALRSHITKPVMVGADARK